MASPRGQVILIRGKAGVGKTTLANALSRKLSIGLLRKDDIYDSLSSHISGHSQLNFLCEQVLYQQIISFLANGQSVILDHTLHYPDAFQRFQNWMNLQNGQLRSILLNCQDEDLWRQRFNQRKINPLPNQLITDFDQLKSHYGSMHTQGQAEELLLDTGKDLAVLVKKAEEWLTPFLN